MNEIGISIIWLAARVTVVCAVVLLVSGIMRRRDQTSTTPTIVGLLLVVLLTTAVFSPWPRWSWNSIEQPELAETTKPSARTGGDSEAGAALPAAIANESSKTQLDSTNAAAWNAFRDAFQRELVSPSVEQTNTSLRWTGWIAVIAICAAVFGFVRLMLGWFSVRRSLIRSSTIDDAELLATLDILQAEMSCTANVELRESSDLTSAATIGFRRPVILLPASWPDWTAAECRMVLAHELAHIASGDAITWLAAQCGLLLHFYHPLVHWLVSRLRLEQELAADARASSVTGGPQTYLVTLAELALREPESKVAWPARAFLPSRGTLLRRIEMLKNSPARSQLFATWRRRLVIALTLIAGIVVAGIRRPESGNAMAAEPATAEPATTATTTVQSDKFNFENVDPSTVLIVAMRPAQLAARDELKPLLKFITESVDPEVLGFGVADIDQFMVVGSPREGSDPGRMGPPVMEVRTLKDVDFGPFIQHFLGETTSQTIAGLTVQAVGDVNARPNTEAAWIVDGRTIIRGPFSGIAKMAAAKKANAAGPAWLERTTAVQSGEIALAMDVSFPRAEIQQTFQRNPNPMLGMVAPLWQKTDLLIGGVDLSKNLALTLHGWAGDEQSAKDITNSLNALLPVAQGLLQGSRASAQTAPPDIQPVITRGIDLGESALKSAKVTQDGNRVKLTLSADGLGVATMTGLLLPAIQQAREAARRTQSKNNLKQIMLALHNYHDTHKTFPPAVLLGPDGKTKYSWRVAILPYLDQQALYEQYRKDEPWDSDNNKKVLAHIPPTFRHPNNEGSTNTSYFAMIGDKTGFGNTDGQGNKIRSFTDGLSNTIMVVEADRDIPWTKPEDIAYDDAKPIPEFGGFHQGGYNAGLADGAVFFISENIDETLLRNLIKRNDGNPVQF